MLGSIGSLLVVRMAGWAVWPWSVGNYAVSMAKNSRAPDRWLCPRSLATVYITALGCPSWSVADVITLMSPKSLCGGGFWEVVAFKGWGLWEAFWPLGMPSHGQREPVLCLSSLTVGREMNKTL